MKTYLKNIFCVLGCVCISFNNAQIPGLDWAKVFSRHGSVERIHDIESTVNGKILVLGFYADTIDFDPGVGTQNLFSKYGSGFLLQLNPSGSLSWVTQFTTSIGVDFSPRELALDNQGNIFIAGSFRSGWVDFDPSPATYSLNSSIYNDGFLLKLDPQGNFIWVKEFNGEVQIKDLHIDAFQNIYLSGFFGDTTDFDPGPLTAIYQGGYNGFVLKLSPSGAYRWVKTFLGNALSEINEVKVSNAGKVYYGGKGTQGTDLDPGAGTYTISNPCAFIGKLDSLGNYEGTAVLEGTGTVYSLLLKGAEIVAAGEYNGTLDLDPGPNQQTVTVSNQDCGFVLKTDTAFNLVWSGSIVSTTTSEVFNMRLTEAPNNDYYLFTHYKGTFDFDPAPGNTVYFTSKLSSWIMAGDIAITQYDLSGNFLSCGSVGPSLAPNVPSSFYTSNKIAIGGVFTKNFDADPSFNDSLINHSGFYQPAGIVLRLADCLRKPSVNLNASRNLICEGDGINLSASGASWYYWGTGLPSAPGVAFTVSATTLYSVTGYDDEGCYAGAAINVVADKCVGLDEETESVPRVYPNPADHSIVIKPGVYRRAQVFDSSGKLLQDYQINETENLIDVKSLPAGIYHLHLEDRYQMRTVQRFIKQ